MRRITKDQLDELKILDESAFHAVQAVSRDLGSDVIAVDDSKLKTAFYKAFHEWIDAMDEEEPSAPDVEIDAVTNPDPKPVAQSAPAKPAVTKATLDAADRNLKDLKEAEDRYLKYWVAEKGLLNSTENGVLIDAWFTAHNLEYSVATIDQAIEACRASLQFYVAPLIERLPNGDERMPLTARPSSRWTKAQLQDWDARTRLEKAATQRRANTELAKSLNRE